MLKDSDFRVWIPDIEEVAEFLEAFKNSNDEQSLTEARKMLPRSQFRSNSVVKKLLDQWQTGGVHCDFSETEAARDHRRVL